MRRHAGQRGDVQTLPSWICISADAGFAEPWWAGQASAFQTRGHAAKVAYVSKSGGMSNELAPPACSFESLGPTSIGARVFHGDLRLKALAAAVRVHTQKRLRGLFPVQKLSGITPSLGAAISLCIMSPYRLHFLPEHSGQNNIIARNSNGVYEGVAIGGDRREVRKRQGRVRADVSC